MSYRPRNVPSNPADLPGFFMVELQSIARATQWRMDVLHKEPDKLQEGLTVLADGTDWNPGSGAGVYTYYGAAWHKLG